MAIAVGFGTASPVDQPGTTSTRRPTRPCEHRALRVGLVNNMPDHTLATTHRQFAHLVMTAGEHIGLELRGYVLPGSELGPAARELHYEDGSALYAEPPDVLVVTGAEPTTTHLDDEPYWEPLAHLLRWAEATVATSLLSCLAAHAALLALDGVHRYRGTSKLTGVVHHQVQRPHPIASGLDPVVALPHSRWHGVRAEELRARGYALVVAAHGSEWSVAHRARAGTSLLLVQGHPEYRPLTLLREHRRDVRRFLAGETGTYPEIPSGYLDAHGQRLLARYRSERESRPTDSQGADFPFDAVAPHVVASWQEASARLFANWLDDACRHANLGTE